MQCRPLRAARHAPALHAIGARSNARAQRPERPATPAPPKSPAHHASAPNVRGNRHHVGVHLKSLTLKGFKSFPDRTKLEFGPGVSVIVGPNGSGKSNITDAVLWAMGEQSPGAIRGQSMQDVIFAGAPGRQASRNAEVELVLDDSDGVLGLGMPEVSI